MLTIYRKVKNTFTKIISTTGKVILAKQIGEILDDKFGLDRLRYVVLFFILFLILWELTKTFIQTFWLEILIIWIIVFLSSILYDQWIKYRKHKENDDEKT